jgi:hypothetical protein
MIQTVVTWHSFAEKEYKTYVGAVKETLGCVVRVRQIGDASLTIAFCSKWNIEWKSYLDVGVLILGNWTIVDFTTYTALPRSRGRAR